MIPAAVHKFPGIYITAEENPGKYQLRNRRWKLHLKWDPLTANEVGKIAQHVGKEERREGAN
jgi:hypothetical protein